MASVGFYSLTFVGDGSSPRALSFSMSSLTARRGGLPGVRQEVAERGRGGRGRGV